MRSRGKVLRRDSTTARSRFESIRPVTLTLAAHLEATSLQVIGMCCACLLLVSANCTMSYRRRYVTCLQTVALVSPQSGPEEPSLQASLPTCHDCRSSLDSTNDCSDCMNHVSLL